MSFSRLDYDTEGFFFLSAIRENGTGHQRRNGTDVPLPRDDVAHPQFEPPWWIFPIKSSRCLFFFFLVAAVRKISVGIMIRTAFYSCDKTLRDQTALLITTE